MKLEKEFMADDMYDLTCNMRQQQKLNSKTSNSSFIRNQPNRKSNCVLHNQNL